MLFGLRKTFRCIYLFRTPLSPPHENPLCINSVFFVLKVAESVFMTSNNPWKSSRNQHQASSGAEGGDDSWHIHTLAAGAVLTPQSFGVYESEHTGYRDEGSEVSRAPQEVT